MFILNFQKLEESELKTDSNFNIAYQELIKSNKDYEGAALIGAAQKPLSIGFIYHIFIRTQANVIIRAEVYLEVFSLKVTIKSVKQEDFNSGLHPLNLKDKSIKKVISVVEKQANNPSLNDGSSYSVQTVEGKDFLFGRLFIATISREGENYKAYLYHDQSSEEVLMLNWGKASSPAGCNTKEGGKCVKCVEGYSMINNLCTFGCGVLCKTVNF